MEQDQLASSHSQDGPRPQPSDNAQHETTPSPPANPQDGGTSSSSPTKKPGIFVKVQSKVQKVFRPRDSVLAELRDIGIVGGLYGLVFFTAGDHLLSTLVALIFSPPSLTQETIARLGNLVVATFPLSIGTAIITAGFIGKIRVIRKIDLIWNPPLSLIFAVVTLWIFTWIGTLLGVGGISSTELNRLIDGPFYVCSTVTVPVHSHLGPVISQTTQHCNFVDASQLYGIWLFLYYLFAFVTVFWRFYGFTTFIAAFVLGIYISWAVSYKLASHLP